MSSGAKTALRDFLLNKVLSDDICVSSNELQVLRLLIRDKIKQLTIDAHKFDDATSMEIYKSNIITAISLKCILSLTNKIEKENDRYGVVK